MRGWETKGTSKPFFVGGGHKSSFRRIRIWLVEGSTIVRHAHKRVIQLQPVTSSVEKATISFWLVEGFWRARHQGIQRMESTEQRGVTGVCFKWGNAPSNLGDVHVFSLSHKPEREPVKDNHSEPAHILTPGQIEQRNLDQNGTGMHEADANTSMHDNLTPQGPSNSGSLQFATTKTSPTPVILG